MVWPGSRVCTSFSCSFSRPRPRLCCESPRLIVWQCSSAVGLPSELALRVNMFVKQKQIRKMYQGHLFRVRVRMHGTRARMTRTNRRELGPRVKSQKSRVLWL